MGNHPWSTILFVVCAAIDVTGRLARDRPRLCCVAAKVFNLPSGIGSQARHPYPRIVSAFVGFRLLGLGQGGRLRSKLIPWRRAHGRQH